MDVRQIANSVAAALTAPINYGANINDASGNQQVTQNIRNLGSLQGQGDIAARAVQALGAGAAAQDDAEKAATRLRAQQAQDEAEAAQKELEFITNPKNYRAVINKAGGYDFYDPMGGKISPVEYAKVTNQHITDLYKNSKDPNDKDFVYDYNRVLELGKILNTGDKTARDKFYAKDPIWKEAYGTTPYNEIVRDLRNKYPNYFRSDKELERTDKIGKTSAESMRVANQDNSIKQKILNVLKGL